MKTIDTTAVEWLMEQITYDNGNGERYNSFIDTVDLLEYFNQAIEMEKQERQKVDKLLDILLENNMCSHAGDKLIEQFKKDNK